MKILLTGGFGYVGGRLAQYLHQAGADVVLGSRTPAAAPNWLPDAGTAITDWSSLRSLISICERMDAVIHLAGMNAQDCADNPALALQMNGVATAHLIEAAAKAGVRRFLYFSTAHVYAAPLAGTISEADCPLNLHPYATSHRAGEDVVRAAHERGDIEGIVIRLSNSFGAPATSIVNCWMLVVNDLARQLATTGRVVLKSTGVQERDFIALGEVSRIVWDLLNLPAARLDNGLFNIGGGYASSIANMTAHVVSRFNNLYGRTAATEIPIGGTVGGASELDYTISKLERTGITLPCLASIDTEIDSLLRFCVDEFA